MIGARAPLAVPGALAAGTLVAWPGGLTAFTAIASAWNGATATLQQLGPDGATLVTVSATQATFTANGTGAVYLPAGQYQATITGGTPTGFYAALDRVPF